MGNAKERMDIFFDKNAPSIVVGIDEYREGYIGIRTRGGKIRVFTEITKDNMKYCKDLMNLVDELRHLDGVRGGIAVSEAEYMATTVLEEKTPLTQVIYSNVKEVVEQGKYIFDTLWKTAVPADQKIMEIESGVIFSDIKIIKNNSESLNQLYTMLENSKHDVVGLFPSINSFERQIKMGLFNLLNGLLDKDVKIRILVPASIQQVIRILDGGTENDSEKAKSKFNFRVKSDNTVIVELKKPLELRCIDFGHGSGLGIVTVDGKESFIIETKDDNMDSVLNSLGTCVHINSKQMALSFVSIFEYLWSQIDLTEKVKAHDKMQEEFINVAAHELRTPIQPILGMADYLNKSADIPQDKKELISIISKNAKRLKRLTNDILDVSKIEGKSFVIQKENFDLISVMRIHINDFIHRNKIDKEIEIEFHYDSSKKMIFGDRKRICQVIANLLDNAFKFTDQGTINIYLKNGEIKNNCVISVEDNGKGIDQKIISKLFTKFTTKSFQGTGLGLYISKSIVEAHGGRIWAENNRDGKGAKFSFSLPLTNDFGN
ncbi:MAG: HAMP domain-containing sensor histidine kinase [Candidatus Nitrosocosmicus sp.]